jgi:CDP-glucose 4,6-dehydratase
LDITKANIKLKWKPILTINETIEMTLEWYLKFKDESVEALSLKQIEFYKEVWKLRNGN